jgi:hypothetical protein
MLTVPLALGIGAGIGHLVNRRVLFSSLPAAGGAADVASPPAQGRAAVTSPQAGRIATTLTTTAIVGMTWFFGLRAAVPTAEILQPLPAEERAAMRWAAKQTPPQSRFLVVTGAFWGADRTSEWFPVLAERISLATVQGYEWTSAAEYDQRFDWFTRLQECGVRGVECLDEWQRTAGAPFSHVYVTSLDTPRCCRPLAAALRQSPSYALLYEGPGAAIFARRP